MIGKRLKLARVNLGLSLFEVENRIGKRVTASVLEQYECDEMMPDSQVLILLAEALGVTENYLVSQRDIQLEGLAFRKNSVIQKRDEAYIENRVLDHLERYLEIEALLNVASLKWDAPRNCPFPVREISAADLIAHNMRDHWQVGMNPIPHFAPFLEERGIKVLSLPLLGEVSGLTCWAKREGEVPVPVIIINDSLSGEWQRFTLSHELGHIVLQVENNVEEESAANRFAGAFLMPTELLWETIGTHRRTLSLGELFELKALLGTSVQAITIRCQEMGIINTATAQRLFEQFRDFGWHQSPYNEPQPCPSEKSDRFKRLCFRALAEDIISEPKAAELLGLSVRQLVQEMDGTSV